MYLSFDLEMDEWLEAKEGPELSRHEKGFLDELPTCLRLLHECETAARMGKNTEILTMIEDVRRVFALRQEAIACRLNGAKGG